MGPHFRASMLGLFLPIAMLCITVSGSGKPKLMTKDDPKYADLREYIGASLHVMTDLEKDELRQDNLTNVVESFPKPKPSKKAKGRQAEALIAGVALLGTLGTGVNAVWGILKKIPEGFQDFHDIVKNVKDTLVLLGLDTKHNAILIDNKCGCTIWVKCWSFTKSTGWHELEEDGFIVRFITLLGHNGFGHWACAFRNAAGKVLETSVYGGDAPKDLWNLYVVKKTKINRIDYETKRVDGLGRALYW